MKEKYLYALLGLILLLSVSFLYYQEVKQRRIAGNEYTVTAFANTNDQYSRQTDKGLEAFSFFIENSSQKETEYLIEFKEGDKNIGSKKVKITPSSTKTISITEETANKLAKKGDLINFSVKISWNGKSRTIYKKIRLN